MILTARRASACLALVLALGIVLCSCSKKTDGAASDPLRTTTGVTGSATGATPTGSGAQGTSSVPATRSSSRSSGAPPRTAVPTSLSALPSVPGAHPTSTPPLTPVSKLKCPAHAAMSTAFGSPVSGDPVDGDDDAKRLYCGYQTASSTPAVLSITTSEDGHAGYVSQADNVRAVANGSGTVQPVLGLGDEALVEMDTSGSSTYAGKLLVRYGQRTVLVVTNSPSSTLERLSRVAALFY